VGCAVQVVRRMTSGGEGQRVMTDLRICRIYHKNPPVAPSRACFISGSESHLRHDLMASIPHDPFCLYLSPSRAVISMHRHCTTYLPRSVQRAFLPDRLPSTVHHSSSIIYCPIILSSHDMTCQLEPNVGLLLVHAEEEVRG
jgi:hypothetical protein